MHLASPRPRLPPQIPLPAPFPLLAPPPQEGVRTPCKVNLEEPHQTTSFPTLRDALLGLPCSAGPQQSCSSHPELYPRAPPALTLPPFQALPFTPEPGQS